MAEQPGAEKGLGALGVRHVTSLVSDANYLTSLRQFLVWKLGLIASGYCVDQTQVQAKYNPWHARDSLENMIVVAISTAHFARDSFLLGNSVWDGAS